MTLLIKSHEASPFKLMLVTAIMFGGICVAAEAADASAVGIFESGTDVGTVELKGSTAYLPDTGQYRITGSGENVWGTQDAFHFAWKKLSGDLVLTTAVGWVSEGQHEHRKAGWMVRQGLAPDAPYADAVVHGDGLISLQYRRTPGGETEEIQSPVRAPASIRLERHGDVFSLEVARPREAFRPVGAVSLKLTVPVHVGLIVCSHNAQTKETALFSNVELSHIGPVAEEDRVIQSSLEVIDVNTGARSIIRRAREHFEAPNWSRNGMRLLYNGGGKLYTIPAGGGETRLLETGVANRCNNDHGFSPDGKQLAISSQHEGSSKIYVLPAAGGTPQLVTPLGPSYWHGWSPDGKTLTYCAERNGEYDVYSIPVQGGEETRLTEAKGLDDGPDYSPDGKYIYFNSVRSGLMKIWRMKADGSDPEQVTVDDEYADWFPHPSPDGKWLVFLSYDKSVEGHPANQDVALRIMPMAGGEPRVLTRLFGGQGTINVPSWSPDSRSVAFVSYARVAPRK